MTRKGKVFTQIIICACWTKGWGTTGTKQMFPDIEDGEELNWLVENGYLFHYQYMKHNKHRNWRYEWSTTDIYGLTKKGWEVAGKFIDEYIRENPEFKLEYQYDCYPKRPA